MHKLHSVGSTIYSCSTPYGICTWLKNARERCVCFGNKTKIKKLPLPYITTLTDLRSLTAVRFPIEPQDATLSIQETQQNGI